VRPVDVLNRNKDRNLEGVVQRKDLSEGGAVKVSQAKNIIDTCDNVF
jgi:hypothetical protein